MQDVAMSIKKEQIDAELIDKKPDVAHISIRRLKKAIKTICSIKKLSEIIHVPYRTLQSYFSGEHMMPLDTFVKICISLQIDSNWVVRGRPDVNAFALKQALKTVGWPNLEDMRTLDMEKLQKITQLMMAYSSINTEEGWKTLANYIKNKDSKLQKIEEFICNFDKPFDIKNVQETWRWDDEEKDLFYELMVK